MAKLVRLCKLMDVPLNDAIGFDPLDEGHDTIFLVKTSQGPFAYKDICPHYGSTSLPWKKNKYLNASGTKIICSAHGAEFELSSGLCVSGPCLGQSLTAVSLSVAEDGCLLASI